MGYLKIPNLYKDQTVLLFKEVYVLSKIHGTSTHLSYNGEKLTFFSGGAKYEDFVKLFDIDSLTAKLSELYSGNTITIYGEGYGGKLQGMSSTYGPNLKFVAFDVRIGNSWLSVPQAESFVENLGLEFVYYTKVSTNLDDLNKERDRDSVQGIRNGMGKGHPEEGIVIRPLIELTKNNGERVIAKYKKDIFRETKKVRNVSQDKMEILKRADEIAEEWVTLQRLNHVIDKINVGIDTCNLSSIIPAMINDIKLESEKEVEWSKECEKSIGKFTAKLVKRICNESLVC